MATQQNVPQSLAVVPLPASQNVRAKVAIHKFKHPEQYCPAQGCLWKTAKLNHATGQLEGGGYCPRHKPAPTVKGGGL